MKQYLTKKQALIIREMINHYQTYAPYVHNDKKRTVYRKGEWELFKENFSKEIVELLDVYVDIMIS